LIATYHYCVALVRSFFSSCSSHHRDLHSFPTRRSSDLLMAVGALQSLRQAGRRVPDDVAVVGFDDIEAAQYTEPPLTTVRHPVAEQAAAMVRLLLGLFEDGPADPVILPTELVVRESA